MTKAKLIYFIFLIPTLTFGQTFTPELKLLIDSIASYDRLDGANVGYAGIRSKQYDRFKRLTKVATTQDLLVLTDNLNSTVKCASFQSLCLKDSIDVIPVLIKHLYDTTRVSIQVGCIGSQLMTGDHFLQTFYFYLSTKDSLYFTSNYSRLVAIDSILFYDPAIKLEYKSSKLKNINSDSLYYDRVREIAEKERLPVSVLALAKYRKQQDKNIIASYFKNDKTQYYAIWAVREFPDSSFYPLLIEVFNREWKNKYYDYPKWRILYQALAKYPNSQTIELFAKTINTKNKFRRETLGRYLLIAINKYPNPLYDKYKSEILVDDFHGQFLNEESDVEK